MLIYEKNDFNSFEFGCGIICCSGVCFCKRNGKNEITYRTTKGAEDISGDYNTYETVETENVSGTEVTVRRNGDIVGSAIWYDEDAYSITSEKGISKDDVLKMVTSVAE